MAQEDAIDGLFALPPEDFIAARDALAKRLRAEGDADTARTVRQLRRPSVAAWAVDQLARAAPEDLQRLLDTGRELRRSQRAALSGAGGGRLREATARRRALLAELTQRAARLLTDAGRSPDAHRAAIAATLEAATVDDEAADLVRSGRLSRELPPPSGFGDLTGLTLVPDTDTDTDGPTEAGPQDADGGGPAASQPADPDAAAEPTARRQAPTAAREETAARERAAEQERERERERVAAQEEEVAARDRADGAEAAAATAEEEATAARRRADAAVETVRDLELRLSEARREREEAERAAVASESSAYRARRAAVEAAERARAATVRSRDTR